MNPLRTEFRKYMLSLVEQSWKLNDSNVLSCLRPAKNARVLDLGCGRGDQTVNWNEKIGASDLTGIEVNQHAAREAKQKGVEVVVCDANRPLPFIDNAFDVIISNQVIEHLVNVDLSLSEMNRVLKPSGYAVVSTENLSSWHNIVALLFGLRPFSLHYSSIRDVGNPFSPHESELMSTVVHEDSPHIKVFTYYALTSIVQLHNFCIDRIRGAGNYIVPLGPLSRMLSRLDPVHSHLLTCRLRKGSHDRRTFEKSSVSSSRIVRSIMSLEEKLPGTFVDLVGRKLSSGITVIDVGCGTGHFLQTLTGLRYIRAGSVVGLDAHLPSLLIARELGIYDDVVCGDVVNMPLREKSFDIALCVEVIEHLPREDGFKLIVNLERVALNKVILTTPNGFTPYLPLDRNEDGGQNTLLQHKSGWVWEDFAGRGYSVIGSGLAVVWGEHGLIRKVPQLLRLILAGISYVLSPVASRTPRASAKIICWKNLDCKGNSRTIPRRTSPETELGAASNLPGSTYELTSALSNSKPLFPLRRSTSRTACSHVVQTYDPRPSQD